MTGRRQVEARWGLPFWQLLADFADQGLSRFDTARAIGYRPDSLCALLNQNPQKNPFADSNRVLAYIHDTGESFRAAVERMAAEGMTVTEVAHAIGYVDIRGLKYALRTRGINVQFRKHSRKQRSPKVDRGPNVTKGWPTWGQIYAIEANRRQ